MYIVNTWRCYVETDFITPQCIFPETLRDLHRTFGALSVRFLPPGYGAGAEGWEFDSLRGNPSVSKPDAQQIYEVLLKMLDRWNAHDI